MKNVTISMDDELAQYTRVEAARAGKSVSRYLADMIERLRNEQKTSEATRAERLARLETAFAGPQWDIMTDGRMPDADERNARQ